MSNIARLYTQLRPTDSPSAIYAAMAEGMPATALVVFGPGIYRELRQELYSIEAIGRWAIALATRLQHPVLLNVPHREGGSHTLTLSPPGWLQERLTGYVAGHHAELEQVFGPIDRLRTMAQ